MVAMTVNEETLQGRRALGAKSSNSPGVAGEKPEREATSSSPKLYKVHIQLSERAYQRLLSLKERADLMSVSEVVREALRVYDALIDETSKGKSLILQDPKTPNERELIKLF